MDSALRQVTEQMDGPLSEEIQRFNREIDLGVPRRQALLNLLNRNTSKELEMLVNSLMQGADLGVPVSTTFRVQAEDLRSMRGFHAKREGGEGKSASDTSDDVSRGACRVFPHYRPLVFEHVIQP